jgi:protein-tyrosine-phosphatase
MQALQRLREMYASADFAFSFLDAAVRRADVAVPTGAPKSAHPGLQTQMTGASAQPSPVMLTPPPEATWTAQNILFASTISAEERKLFTGFTPPKSDHSLNSIMTGGAAIALTDLPMSDAGESEGHESVEEQEARQLEEQALHDFDALINMEGDGQELSPLSNEDKTGVYAAMEDAWLNGMNDEADGPNANNSKMGMVTNMYDGHDNNDFGLGQGHIEKFRDAQGGSKSSELQALLESSIQQDAQNEQQHMGGYVEASKVTGDLDTDLQGWN